MLALGGGSVIDASKIIAAQAATEENYWNVFVHEHRMPADKPLPLGAIVTASGTGAEMNGGAVITNDEEHVKTGVFAKALVFAILDPAYTKTVPHMQVFSGAFTDCNHGQGLAVLHEFLIEWGLPTKLGELRSKVEITDEVLDKTADTTTIVSTGDVVLTNAHVRTILEAYGLIRSSFDCDGVLYGCTTAMEKFHASACESDHGSAAGPFPDHKVPFSFPCTIVLDPDAVSLFESLDPWGGSVSFQLVETKPFDGSVVAELLKIMICGTGNGASFF